MKNLLWNFKKVFFKDTDLLTAETLNNTDISDKTMEIFRLRGSLKQINNIYYFWNYDKDFKLLISKLKFRGQKNIAKNIACLIESGVKFVLERENIDYIIPVPISIQRESERGFNQTEVLLDAMKIQYLKIKRIKNTKKMFKILEENKRNQNIKNSFFINKETNLSNKNILLFDDIVTTGATLREIKSEILKKYKVNKIAVLALAAAREIKVNKGKV
ncbi:MAG: ComF family protein [Fusobacteriales bacterium]|jgi:ComF family protein|nr:ComF family protein [Fusobacteriales bacterium]